MGVSAPHNPAAITKTPCELQKLTQYNYWIHKLKVHTVKIAPLSHVMSIVAKCVLGEICKF